jgi:CubicO group peptidase (beta-lactamase class C family)
MQFDPRSFSCGLILGAALVLIPVGIWFVRAHQQAVREKPVAVPGPDSQGASVGDEMITSLLQPIRQKFDMPAMAAAVITGENVPRCGAVGVLKRGSTVPVRLDCLWHLGSDTKAMTSTLVAKLAEQHKVRWDSTLAEIFPDLASGMNQAFCKVTVRDLLTHRAGLPANLDYSQYVTGNVQALRRRAVRDATAGAPVNGGAFLYSNLGYILAGAVVEKVTGQSWEQAITQALFEPLGMHSAGFGATGTPGQVDQPWPHAADGTPAPENGPAADNPPILGPAGRVHCTIQDWARFVQDQLRGDRGEPALLAPESYQQLHAPAAGGDYAMGWIAVERSWGGGRVYNHGGDNTMNFANVWMAPQRDFAILVCVNQGGQKAFEATDAAVGALLKTLPVKILPKP